MLNRTIIHVFSHPLSEEDMKLLKRIFPYEISVEEVRVNMNSVGGMEEFWKHLHKKGEEVKEKEKMVPVVLTQHPSIASIAICENFPVLSFQIEGAIMVTPTWAGPSLKKFDSMGNLVESSW